MTVVCAKEGGSRRSMIFGKGNGHGTGNGHGHGGRKATMLSLLVLALTSTMALTTLLRSPCTLTIMEATATASTTKSSGSGSGGGSGSKPMVGIAIVSDARFLARQRPFVEVNRMYAERHGYDLHVLDPADVGACRYDDDFFFNKHCAVRVHLARMPPGYAMVVLDGDVIATSPSVSLDRWLSYRSPEDGRAEDVILYERGWNYELTAGNYIVRNTPFGLLFLDIWMRYYLDSLDVKGFSSSDNGAVHLAVLQALNLPPREYRQCVTRYRNLTSSVEDLTEYFQFVACTRRALGPNRRWVVRGDGDEAVVGGSLTVHHRYHGFAIDAAVIAGRKRDGAIPFTHGEKDPEAAVRFFYRDDHAIIPDAHTAETTMTTSVSAPAPQQDDIHVRADPSDATPKRENEITPSSSYVPPSWPSHSAHGMAISATDNWLTGNENSTMPWSVVPRVRLGQCVRNFTCQPALMGGMPDRFAYRDASVLVLDYDTAFLHDDDKYAQT